MIRGCMVGTELRLNQTVCAICGCLDNADEVYPSSFRADDLNPDIFSARRRPDRIHYRIVRCRDCGLLRSDPVADASLLNRLYERSSFDYGAEVENLRLTYRKYLAKVPHQHGSLLEIGCGNGFVLQEASALGYSEVAGVEPSRDAVGRAATDIRRRIVCGTMRPGLFGAGQFDTVAMFQVLDHLPEPAEVVRECLRVLKPGGHLLCLQHDAGAWSARLLGERSPIFDIEHTYLYNRTTLPRLVGAVGFETLNCRAVWNRYSLTYLAHLAGLQLPSWARLPLWAPLGNFYLIARKPL